MSKFLVIGTQVNSHIDRTICSEQSAAENHAKALLRKDRNVRVGLTELYVVKVVSTVRVVKVVSTVRVAGPPLEVVPEVDEPEVA